MISKRINGKTVWFHAWTGKPTIEVTSIHGPERIAIVADAIEEVSESPRRSYCIRMTCGSKFFVRESPARILMLLEELDTTMSEACV